MSSAKKKLTYGIIASDMAEGNMVQMEYRGARRTYEFSVKKCLDFDEAMEFVSSVVALCSDGDSNEYRPQALDFAIRLCTLSAYANIELPGEANIKKAYDAVYNTDIYYMVRSAVDKEQYDALIHAAVQRIKYERDMAVSAAAAQINQLISKMNEVMADGEQIVDQLSSDEMAERMRELERLFMRQSSEKAVDDSADGGDDKDNIVRLRV